MTTEQRRCPAFPPLRTLAVALLLAGAMPPAVAAAEGKPVASGHGRVKHFGAQPTLAFSFDADRQDDGSVTGRALFHNLVENTTTRLEVNCLRILPGYAGSVVTAVVSGVVSQTDAPNLSVGQSAIFRVEDNGEGKDAPPDRMTVLAPLRQPADCKTAIPPAAGPLALEDAQDTGNIRLPPSSP